MSNIVKLEKFWRDLILAFSSTENLRDAIIVCYPKAPFFAVNHAAAVNVHEEKAKGLLDTVEAYFRSRKVPFVCFRVSPLTRPESFAALLAAEGFKLESEQSVMVLKGAAKVSSASNISVEKIICESEVDVYNKLMLKIFEMPPEWENGLKEFNLESMRKGWRFYLAYAEGKPVSTCALFSSSGIGGIFNVGTLPDYRRQGIGTALTLQALQDSVAEGNTVHTLQAEHGGNAEKLYSHLGFKIDHKIQFYARDITLKP